jgi:predicted phage terminase large subunit-like protein
MRADDVYSTAARTQVKRFYDNTLVTRLNSPKKGKIVLVMQRLHVDDLTAHVRKDSRFHYVVIPARASATLRYRLKNSAKVFHAGRILDPKRDSKGNLRQLRQSMGAARFEAQYQQNPVPEDGDLIKRNWFRKSDADTSTIWDAIVQSWDTATSDAATSAYSVCLTWGIRGKSYHLLDVFRERLDINELKRAVIKQREKWHADHVLVEHASSGISIYQIFRQLSAIEGVAPVIPCKPKGTKLERLMRQIALIEEGRVYLPEAMFVEHFLEEVTLFPGGPYDDCVDALTQFLRWVRDREFEKGRKAPRRRRVSRASNPDGAAARVGRLQRSTRPRRSVKLWDWQDLFRSG